MLSLNGENVIGNFSMLLSGKKNCGKSFCDVHNTGKTVVGKKVLRWKVSM